MDAPFVLLPFGAWLRNAINGQIGGLGGGGGGAYRSPSFRGFLEFHQPSASDTNSWPSETLSQKRQIALGKIFLHSLRAK